MVDSQSFICPQSPYYRNHHCTPLRIPVLDKSGKVFGVGCMMIDNLHFLHDRLAKRIEAAAVDARLAILAGNALWASLALNSTLAIRSCWASFAFRALQAAFSVRSGWSSDTLDALRASGA